jgi:hypothetical protein
LGLLTQDENKTVVGLGDAAVKAFGEPVATVLAHGDVESAGHFVVPEDERGAGAFGGLLQTGGEEATLERGATEDFLLSEGDALDGETLLGVGGLVVVDGVGYEVGEGFGRFEADDGVVSGVEDVFARVLGRAGFALGGARSGGVGGIGSVGSETFGGDGFGRHGLRFLTLQV